MEQGGETERELVVQRAQCGGDAPRAQMRCARKDGWTEARRTQFLDVLIQTCNISEGLRVVGMSDSSLYDLRKRDPAFAARWSQALDDAYFRLEWMLVQRATYGDERVVTVRQGSGDEATVKATKTITNYSPGVAWKLLLAHRASVERHRAERAAVTMSDEEARERMCGMMSGLEQKIDRLEGRQERRRQAALERRAAKRAGLQVKPA